MWWYDEEKMLFPNPIGFDDQSRLSTIRGYHLFKNINFPKRTYFHLHGQFYTPYDLPPGYDFYLLSWQMEQVDFEWLERQKVTGPIVVLTDLKTYNNDVWPKNVTSVRWIYWHYALDQMIKLFGTTFKKNIKYKFSAFCNRITQSKMLISTALLECVDRKDLLIKLGTWLEEKNVHHWHPTGNAVLDHLAQVFQQKYLGHEILIDDFNDAMNYQHFTGNPNQSAYQETAIHFTNENWHYSLTQKNNKKILIPGPHISEKTFKCLLGGTAFIPVGQFDTYQTLADLGFCFDYGFDLGFDQEPGDIDRFVKIIELIHRLNEYSTADLYQMTQQSSAHNQDWVTSGKFYRICEDNNLQSLSKILEITKNV